jgi:hypothetical protein
VEEKEYSSYKLSCGAANSNFHVKHILINHILNQIIKHAVSSLLGYNMNKRVAKSLFLNFRNVKNAVAFSTSAPL